MGESDNGNAKAPKIQIVDNSRDARGRFQKGNSISPGRKSRAFEESRLNLLSEAVTDEKWQAIIDKAIAQASEGDRNAREWIAQYLLPPRPVVAARWMTNNHKADTLQLTWGQTMKVTQTFDVEPDSDDDDIPYEDEDLA